MANLKWVDYSSIVYAHETASFPKSDFHNNIPRGGGIHAKFAQTMFESIWRNVSCRKTNRIHNVRRIKRVFVTFRRFQTNKNKSVSYTRITAPLPNPYVLSHLHLRHWFRRLGKPLWTCGQRFLTNFPVNYRKTVPLCLPSVAHGFRTFPL